MVVITGSLLFSETWNIVHALVSGNNVDPRARAKKWVFGDFPDTEGPDFPGYPLIVIENPQPSMESITFSADSLHDTNMDISVTAYSKTNKEVNQLNENIYNAIATNHAVLAGSGFLHQATVPGTAGTDVIGNQRIHFNEQIFTLRSVLS